MKKYYYMKNVLDNILRLREKKGWSEYKLSVESQVPQTTISSWYNKKNSYPTLPSLNKICDALNVTMSELFSNDESKIDLTKEQLALVNASKKLSKAQLLKLIEYLES